MIPIRVAGATVEPVSLAEMRGYLRLDPDDAGAEDPLLRDLIAAARASLEAETRRALVPGTYRIVLHRRPQDGWVPIPLSPLVAVVRAESCGADGTVTALAPGLVALGPDPVEAPCLSIAPTIPFVPGHGLMIEVAAGYGGDGPPLPPPLKLAIQRLAAARYEHRGDEAVSEAADPSALAAPFRRLRL
ncbi:hypothetical protein [uncultured Methylobacterium sp.]|uniref:head-tail connector protein n=1 Tax=uncultured Methylobacterium sp. TaxID=157278 RepID=UPI0035CC3D4D